MHEGLLTVVGVHGWEQVVTDGTQFVERPFDAIQVSVQRFKLHIGCRPGDIKVSVSERRGLQDESGRGVDVVNVAHVLGVRLIHANRCGTVSPELAIAVAVNQT